MPAIKIRRKAATPKGFLRRLEDARFMQVDDPRDPRRIKHPLSPVLNLAVLSLCTQARSTRAVEMRAEQLSSEVKSGIDLAGRISDNAFGLLMPRLEPNDLRHVLRSQVKAEWKRKNLRPTRLPWSTAAIDGKHVATLNENQIRSLISRETPLDGEALDADGLGRVLHSRFPQVQLQNKKENGLVGLIRVHRATLISSGAAVVMDQQPIWGETNEWGTIKQTLRALFGHYKKTKMVEMVTMDAGNTTQEVAALIARNGADYLLALKSVQGRIFEDAHERLGALKSRQADFSFSEEYNGQTVCYSVWSHLLCDGHPDYPSARQLIRVERVAATDEETTVGNRYFVGSMPAEKMSAKNAWTVARAHWRCENEGHWTADAIWEEDARRTPWTTHPSGVLSVGILRALAINILAVLRAMSRIDYARKVQKPPWKAVIEHALLALCDTFLDTSAFDACDG
jgi:predicted transposase YbfD/YdcC